MFISYNFHFQVAMASEYGTCPICMEDYDLDTRMPKSLHCRHSMCKLCLGNCGHPLSSCPICRHPVKNPGNIPNDLTMIDYLHHLQRQGYLKEQEAMRKKLRDMTESVKEEIGHIENFQVELSRTVDWREKVFSNYSKSLFEECLERCSLKDSLRHGESLSCFVKTILTQLPFDRYPQPSCFDVRRCATVF